MYQQLETEPKALEINLDQSIYGTFAEIGAGQEVARHFFQVGGAAGTIAKTMSAYDKIYSDRIYGPEDSGRYVCESRLYKMLDHEYDLLESRLQTERPNTLFFAFADTIAAINYHRTINGDGWLGIRFQLEPGGGTNDLVIHVSMLDNDNRLQQQAVGILGVNLIYACFRYHTDPETMVISLLDGLHGRAKIDMIRLTGPDFDAVNNKLLSLYLVKHHLTEMAMFGPEGKNVHASEFLYKKYLMVVRSSFRPPTLTHLDMLKKSYKQFKNHPEVAANNTFILAEIPLDSLCKPGKNEPDEKDFLDRATLLNALGYTVILSSCADHQRMLHYFSDFKIRQLAVVLEAHKLLDLINQKYYQNLDGRLIAAFGELFTHEVRVYTYPSLQEGSPELMTAHTLPIPEGVKFLYRHLLDNQQIVDIEDSDPQVLNIFTKQVYDMLRDATPGWEKMVPPKVAKLIKETYLFDYPSERIEFEY